MVPEKLRRREVHKYYQAWLDSSIGFDATASREISRSHADGSQIRVSKDKALIAFAQLGCLRLQCKRSVVTLISSEQQYILAEATKTLSLVSGDGDAEVQDQIWFGNASLPRSQGISGDALAPDEYTAVGTNGATYTAAALVIDDITLHEKYRHRDYAGKGVTFYCGVPILTDDGVNIGVYTVIDDKPRNGLQPDELRFVHDMAATVMRHLDVVRNEAARFRGETLVLGLGRFISGAPNLQDARSDQSGGDQHNAPGPRQSHDHSARLFKGMTITAASPSAFGIKNPPLQPLEVPQTDPTKSKTHEISDRARLDASKDDIPSQTTPELQNPLTLPDNIFSRAARILQECVDAEGVLFFDAVSTNFGQQATFEKASFSQKRKRSRTHSRSDSRQESANVSPISPRKDSIASIHSGVSEESDGSAGNDGERRICKILGHAIDTYSESSNSGEVLNNIRMTERSLGRLVKMYPDGKVFTFHTDGGLSTSDGEHLTHNEAKVGLSLTVTATISNDGSKHIPRALAAELERLVPHARNIVWLPLWDFSKHRWSAGLFLWSRRPDRLVAAQDDLVYLKAFANSIMVEVARLDAARADTAKSTFIANISHELRTPLHGILGNLDILQDTKLNEFQLSLVTAIEVCGRTLSDTIDHVLDYSKINQLSKYHRRKQKSVSESMVTVDPEGHTNGGIMSMADQEFNIAAIVEEAVEAAYASYTFQSSGRIRLSSSSSGINQRPSTPSKPQKESSKVRIIINLEHRDTWWVRSQPSAIRRVVTNLFGNALKYTDTGTIQVTLSCPRLTSTFDSVLSIPILLTVKDTGRGMSADFVRNHAFMPFSQESQFSVGTGLGLSIVQQIVKSLGGKIELQSDKGVGTEIKVFLDLPASDKNDQSSTNLTYMLSKPVLEGIPDTTIAVMTSSDYSDERPPSGFLSEIVSLERMAIAWFKMKLTSVTSISDAQPDVVLYSTPPAVEQLDSMAKSLAFPSRTRFIIVAPSIIEKAALATKFSENTTLAGLQIELLAYPVGPHKLGQALLRCLGIGTVKGRVRHLRLASDGSVASSRSLSPQPNLSASADEPTNKAATHEEEITKRYGSHARKVSQSTMLADEVMPKKLDDQAQSTRSHSHNESDTVNQKDSHNFPESVVRESSSKSLATRLPAPIPRSISAPVPLLVNKAETQESSTRRVLLVDDNDINLNILKTCMKRARIPFEYAKDGLQASNCFQQAFNAKSAFTHVLMDISMPVMDGIQSTRAIREFERRHHHLQRRSSRSTEVPCTTSSLDTIRPIDMAEASKAFIIALSGVASDVTQLEMLEAGADMFLPKPVKLKELIRILGS